MKHYYKGLTVTLAALILAACGVTPSSSATSTPTTSTPTTSTPTTSITTSSETPTTSTPTSTGVTLTSITIAGADDVTLDFEATFNLFTGVTATGNNGTSYTSQLTMNSTSSAVNTTTGALDTTKTGLHAVRYNITVGSVTAQKWRYITVSQPTSTGLLVNPDFSLGTAGWDDPSVVYIADGAAMTLTTEAGELKAEVTAGANFYTPRFGQMNIPFEQGKTYEVSFEARSSVDKQIALQVGELLAGPPYFTDFLPSIENIFYRNITTTMQTYSYQFTMTQNNPRGGILFGLGRINNISVNATLYFDNIEIVETTLGEDTAAPIFAGVLSSINILVGANYDPLVGVTAIDVVDGDLTDEIVVEIFNSLDQKVSAVDTSAPGVFTVKYSVEDANGNEATAQTTVNIVSLAFKDENLLVNGDFTTAIGAEWGYYQLTDADTWAPNPKPIVVRTQDTVEGTYSLDITNGGGFVWAIQFFQDGVNLVEGTTYRFSVMGSASVARKISVGIGYSFGDNQWNEYGRKNGIELSTTSSTQDFVFTVTKATADVKVVLELGSQDGFADGIVTLDQVRLQRLEADALIANNQFDLTGWRGYFEPGVAKATSGVVNGEFKVTVSEYSPYPQSWDVGATASSYHLQIVQDAESLVGIPGAKQFLDLEVDKTYTLSFDAYASQEVTVTPNVFGQNIWVNHTQSPETILSTSKQTFTKTISTVGATLNDTEKLAFEFGKGVEAILEGGTPVSVYFDNVSIKEGSVALTSLYNGDFETVLGGHATDGDATMKQTADGASITVNSLGEPWQPHYYYILPNLATGTYQLRFVVTSSVTRNLRFNVVLPDAGFASILEGGFSDFAVTANEAYTFTATLVITQPLTNVKLELDFGNLGGTNVSTVGTFVISEVLFYKNFNV